MSVIKVHASNFKCYGGDLSFGKLSIRTPKHRFIGEEIKCGSINTLDVESRDTNKKAGGAIGWGLAGDIAFGPVGAVAGLVLGGNKKKTTFILELNDGRKLVATADTKDFTKFHAKFLVGETLEPQKESVENNNHNSEIDIVSSEGCVSSGSEKTGWIKITLTLIFAFIGCFLSWAFYDIAQFKMILFPVVVIFIPLYMWWKKYLIREFRIMKYTGEAIFFFIIIYLLFAIK